VDAKAVLQAPGADLPGSGADGRRNHRWLCPVSGTPPVTGSRARRQRREPEPLLRGAGFRVQVDNAAVFRGAHSVYEAECDLPCGPLQPTTHSSRARVFGSCNVRSGRGCRCSGDTGGVSPARLAQASWWLGRRLRGGDARVRELVLAVRRLR
jgi:hypothetical protein